VDILRCLKGTKRDEFDCMYAHTICLAKFLLSKDLEAERTKMLIPLRGPCPRCKKSLAWGDLVDDFVARTSKATRKGADASSQSGNRKRKPKASKGGRSSQSQSRNEGTNGEESQENFRQSQAGGSQQRDKTQQALKRAKSSGKTSTSDTGSGGEAKITGGGAMAGPSLPKPGKPPLQPKKKSAGKDNTKSQKRSGGAPRTSDLWSYGLTASMDLSPLSFSESDDEDLPAVFTRLASDRGGHGSGESDTDLPPAAPAPADSIRQHQEKAEEPKWRSVTVRRTSKTTLEVIDLDEDEDDVGASRHHHQSTTGSHSKKATATSLFSHFEEEDNNGGGGNSEDEDFDIPLSQKILKRKRAGRN